MRWRARCAGISRATAWPSRPWRRSVGTCAYRRASCPRTVPLERAAGRNVFGLLPHGAGRINWPALLTEAQMLLAESDVNTAREPAKPSANGVWFWGEGQLPERIARRYALVCAREPFALGLARLTGAEAREPPASLADVDLVRAGDSALVVLDALVAPLRRGDEDGWVAAAEALDERWFAKLEHGDRAVRIGAPRAAGGRPRARRHPHAGIALALVPHAQAPRRPCLRSSIAPSTEVALARLARKRLRSRASPASTPRAAWRARGARDHAQVARRTRRPRRMWTLPRACSPTRSRAASGC